MSSTSETSCWPKRAHLIGVGGSGMSGLALLLHGLGVEVSGSDDHETPHVQRLRGLGLNVEVGRRLRGFGAAEALVVRSAAVPESHEEWQEGLASGSDCKLYAAALGDLSRQLKTVAVAGTHGKTSTTALTVAAMRGGALDPSFLVGADVPELGGNGYAGGSPFLVLESCEFNRSFHELQPHVAVLLNIEVDHFDCYASLDELVQSFARFAAGVPAGGSVLAHETVPAEALSQVRAGVCVYRIGAGQDVSAEELLFESGRVSFRPQLFGHLLPRTSLRVLGRFQATNALFALAAASLCGAYAPGAAEGLAAFPGVARRLECIETRHGPLLFDYAHHPSEIAAVLETVRSAFPGRPLCVAFQPHQHSRTRCLLEDFAKVLASADRCLIADIFAAREDPDQDHGVSSGDLAAAIRAYGGKAEAVGKVERLGSCLQQVLKESDSAGAGDARPLPLVLGAGELDGVVKALVRDE
ncbi:MAG: hypothetical protein CSA62_04045 [Planctomycetota bacterium]|nr:MAG: hypothetical protein CSA62_04045 [Planctomycetota bacterium]